MYNLEQIAHNAKRFREMSMDELLESNADTGVEWHRANGWMDEYRIAYKGYKANKEKRNNREVLAWLQELELTRRGIIFKSFFTRNPDVLNGPSAISPSGRVMEVHYYGDVREIEISIIPGHNKMGLMLRDDDGYEMSRQLQYFVSPNIHVQNILPMKMTHVTEGQSNAQNPD